MTKNHTEMDARHAAELKRLAHVVCFGETLRRNGFGETHTARVAAARRTAVERFPIGASWRAADGVERSRKILDDISLEIAATEISTDNRMSVPKVKYLELERVERRHSCG